MFQPIDDFSLLVIPHVCRVFRSSMVFSGPTVSVLWSSWKTLLGERHGSTLMACSTTFVVVAMTFTRASQVRAAEDCDPPHEPCVGTLART